MHSDCAARRVSVRFAAIVFKRKSERKREASDEPVPVPAASDEPAAGELALREDLRFERANAIVNRNVLWALSLGLVPVPLFDLIAQFAVQLKLLRELAQLYGVKFSEDLAKKLLSSLLSSASGVSLGMLATMSIGKLVPLFGTVSMSIVNGAMTYATGRVFTMHFESGGTLLDFDPRKMRAHFEAEFERGKRQATKLREEAVEAKQD
jgi:uncharacterized protein (DUF697 family)